MPAYDDGAGWHETILLPDEILNNSPSRRHGVSEEVELHHRIFGCELIQEAGILLKSPQVVMATGQNLLQRFYYRQSLTNDHPSTSHRHFKCDAFSVAMGCLFLSCKIEESPRRPRDVVAVFHRMAFRRKGLEPEILDYVSDAYHLMKSTMFDVERLILKELGFSFYNIMDHPHKFILYYIKVLQCEKDMAQKAWNYLNDSLRLDCCVRFKAELVACAAIYMAARDLRVKLPESPPWWELFGVTLSDIKQVGDRILSLYHQPRLHWLEPLHPKALVAEAEFHKLMKKRKPAPSSSTTTGMPPPASPLVILTPAEGTPAAQGTTTQAKPDKVSPDKAAAGPGGSSGEAGGGALQQPSVTPSTADQGLSSGPATKSPSVDPRAKPTKSESRERPRQHQHHHHRKHKRRSRSRSRSRSPLRDRRRRDRSRSRDRGGRNRDRDRGRDRDRSRSRDRSNRR